MMALVSLTITNAFVHGLTLVKYIPIYYIDLYAIDLGITGPNIAFYLLSILMASSIVGRIIPVSCSWNYKSKQHN